MGRRRKMLSEEDAAWKAETEAAFPVGTRFAFPATMRKPMRGPQGQNQSCPHPLAGRRGHVVSYHWPTLGPYVLVQLEGDQPLRGVYPLHKVRLNVFVEAATIVTEGDRAATQT